MARTTLPKLGQRVHESEAIVIGTILDYAISPRRPEEWQIRFHVDRVLKGTVSQEVVVLQTPTDPNNLVKTGRTWILMLNHLFLAGRWPYGHVLNQRYEGDVNAFVQSQGT